MGKRVLRIFTLSIIALVVIYLFFVAVFWNKFLPGTKVNGKSVALLSASDVTVNLFTDTRQHRIVLYGVQGSKESMSFESLGVYREQDNYFVDWEMPSWDWVTRIFYPVSYTVSDEWFYNPEQIRKAVSQLDMVTGVSREDMSDLRVVKDGDSYELVRTMNGQYIDTDRLVQVIQEHLDAHDYGIDLEAEDCYLDTGTIVEGQDVEASVSDMQQILNAKIVLDFGSQVTEQVPDTVLQGAVYQTSDGNVMLRSNVIYSYLVNLAQQYDTVDVQRLFQPSDGDEIDLTNMESSTYHGFELDKDALFTSLLNQLSAGESGTILVPWRSVGRDLTGESDMGNTYLEISLSRQHLWYYQNGNLIADADVVTGDAGRNLETPVGIFYVRSLNEDYTMYYPDGSAKCQYFIAVTPDGVGIHDALWRDSFGGTQYQTSGSHGCINTPFDTVETIFESLSAMDDFHIPVVIYD